MGTEKVLARFLRDQCEWGTDLELSEAILYVVLSGWCKVEREELPTLSDVRATLELKGARRRNGNIQGIRLRGVDEKAITDLLGPALYGAMQKLTFGPTGAESPEPVEERPEWARGISGDSVLAFVDKCCERLASKSSSLRELYESYVEFCKLNSRRPVKEERFRSTLESSKVGIKIAGRRVCGLLPTGKFLEAILRANGKWSARATRARIR